MHSSFDGVLLVYSSANSARDLSIETTMSFAHISRDRLASKKEDGINKFKFSGELR